MNVKRLLSQVVFVSLMVSGVTARAVVRQALQGHVPMAVARVQILGRLAGTERLDVSIGLPLRNTETLTNLLQQIYDPASPQYHRYLTPEQFTTKFGPTEEDYQAVISFAQANGLTIAGRHPNRTLLALNGSVADIEKAFHTTFHIYPHPTDSREFYAPDTEPSLDISVPILHINGLNNYKLARPMNFSAVPSDMSVGAIARNGSGPSGAYIGSDFRAAYAPGVTLTGSGQAVGLFELDGYFASDITAYLKQAGLTSVPLRNVLIGGFNGIPTSRQQGSGNVEVALDIEMAISVAPGLTEVIVYEGSPFSTMATINNILNRMATDNKASQLSCSWGFDINLTTQQIFQQYAAQGQSFFLASGDSGAFANEVFQPSDNPNITVVGGTAMTTSDTHDWVSEDAWLFSSGGISTIYPIPSWQTGIDMSTNQGSISMRNVPDVAMLASNVWITANRGGSYHVTGTSIAAPLLAAFTALVNEQAAASGKPAVGFMNPALYTIGKGTNYANAFHDITSGNNTNSSSSNRFFAVPGYDLCTGWGTPNGSNFINALLELSPADLVIAPPLGFTANRAGGGPFNVTSQAYSLSNAGMASLSWSIGNPAGWLDVSPTSGTLEPGDPPAIVTVGLNSAASNVLIATYAARVWFTNLNNGTVQDRPFSLVVGNGGFETGDFSGWTLVGKTNTNFADSIDASMLHGSPTIAGVDDRLFVHSGIFGAFLGQGLTMGSLTKTLPTQPGQPYLLSFSLDNPTNGIPNEFRAIWNGNTLFDEIDMDQFAWTNLQYMVTATGTNTTLQFRFRNDQNAFGLDDISVEPVPAPRFQAVAQTDNAITFTWNAKAGFVYQLQYASDLILGDWTNLGASVIATNEIMTVSDIIDRDLNSKRLYRILMSR